MKQQQNRLNLITLATLASLTPTLVYSAEDVVVVTASGFEQSVKQAPASISVITREELENKPFRDLTDALRDIPGVTITGGKGSTDISIRGMGAKYTLILIDGKRQSSRETRPNSDSPGIEQGWIPPLSAIERIEVIRGPMSSLYGSDAMGGVINIITRKVAKTWGGSVRLEQTIQDDSQSSNPSSSDLYLNGPLIDDILGLQIYGKYASRDEDKYLTGYPEQKLGSVNGRLSYTPNEIHTFQFEAGSSLQKRIASAGKTASRLSEHKSRRENQSVSHNGKWGFATTDLTLSHENTDNYVRHMEIDNKTVDGQILVPLDNNMFTFGGQYRKEALTDSGNQLNPALKKLSRWNYSLFMEDELRLTDSFALTGGLRYDYDQNYGNHWSPRIYGVWDMTETLALKGGISTGYTAPSLRQVVSDWGQVTGGGSSKGMILGNPDLKPEKSTSYEVGLHYLNDDGLSASATGYYTQFKDKIQSYYLCDGPSGGLSCTASNGDVFDFIQSRTNVDEATLRGFEFAGKIPLPADFTLSANYTWSDSEQKTGRYQGQALNRIPKHAANSTLDWRANDKLNLWTKVSFNGKETTTSTAKPVEYPSYTQWDLGGSFKVNQQTTIYTGVYNLTDKQIREKTVGRTLDGRRYWVALNIDF
jgi:outer membrane receptor for ferrienterochelin and colicins